MKFTAICQAYLTTSVAVFCLAIESYPAFAEQPSNKASQTYGHSKPELGRAKLFRRFREEPQTARRQAADTRLPSAATPVGPQASISNNSVRRNHHAPNQTGASQSPNYNPIQPQLAQQNRFGAEYFPAIRPPNRIPTPTLAPPLKTIPPQIEVPSSNSDFVELTLDDSGPGISNSIDQFEEQALRESISQKEREIRELTEQLQALRRRLANASLSTEF